MARIKSSSLVLSRRRITLAVVILVALVAAWPSPQNPRMWPDSVSYVSMATERMPVYTMIASLMKPSYLLVCFSFLVSLAAWCWLGFRLGRAVGFVVGAAFAISLPVYVWHLVVLSETLSLTLLAAVLAATLVLTRRWTKAGFRLWCCLLLLFALTRTINLFVIPFLLAPFLVCGRRRLLMAVLAVVVVTSCGVLYSRTLGTPLRETSLTNIYMRRVAQNKELSAYFTARGMPFGGDVRGFVNKTGSGNKLDLFEASPEFAFWLRDRGGSEYFRWVTGRSASYKVAWNQLYEHVNDNNRRFSAGTRMRSAPKALEPLYVWLYLPFWLWLPALLLPVMSRCVYGRVKPVTLLAAAMVVAAYVQAFVGYFGDATEESRHMVSAFFLYKITVVIMLLEVARVVFHVTRRLRHTPDYKQDNPAEIR